MDIFKEIIDWANGLPSWQREAVRLLLENGELADADVADLVARVKSGDDEKVVVAIPSPQPTGTAAVALTGLEHICGVNALAEGQTLSFLGPLGLTIIYGENGSGKSGYSRILKHACRSREKKPDPIQGDVYRQGKCPAPRARFTYLDGGTERSEEWTPGCAPSEALRTVALFDANCSRLYVEKDGDLAFQPYGLEVFKQLADACSAVKDALDKEAQAITVSAFPNLTHPAVVEAVDAALAKHTEANRARVAKLATLSEKETKRADSLQSQIAQLENNDPKKLAEGCRRLANRLETTVKFIGAAATTTAQQLKLAPEAVNKRNATAKLAAEASKMAFEKEPVKGVGSDPWKLLFQYAREFSVAAAYPKEEFPFVGDDANCVLCHQRLDDDAKERMARFAEFVGNRAEEEAKAALAAYQTVRTSIIDTARGIAATEDSLIEQVDGWSENAALEFRNAKNAHATLLTSVQLADTEAAWKKLRPPVVGTQELVKLTTKLKTDAAAYEKNSNEEERRKLKAELALLRDRQTLAKFREGILKAAQLAAKQRRLAKAARDISTRPITDKGGKITEEVLTPELCRALNAELTALGADHLKVEYVRKGRVGEQRHYLKLSKAPDGTNVQDILSEGEHRCLGIAAFLSELDQAGHTSGIVLDDPVSSLDHKHRDALATRLVEEAGSRQVVVFTHDLTFLYDLNRAAARKGVEVLPQAVAYFTAGAGVVANQQYPDAMSAKQYVAYIRGKADEIVALGPRDATRRGKIADLYLDMRVAWERVVEEALLCSVVSSMDKAVHTQKLKGIVLDDAIYTEVFFACEDTNAVSGAHRTPAAAGPAPTRTDAQIKGDVEHLAKFRKDCEDRADLAERRRKKLVQPRTVS